MKEEEIKEDEKKEEQSFKDSLFDLLNGFQYKEEAEKKDIVKDYFRLIQKDAFKDDPEGYKEAAPELETYFQSEDYKVVEGNFITMPDYALEMDAFVASVKTRVQQFGPTKKATEAVSTYQNTMELFNTRRASVFKDESPEHVALRRAGETLWTLREHTLRDHNSDPKGHLQAAAPKEKLEFAKQWLAAAHELHDTSRKYLKEKGSITITPTGRDRKRAAEQLKQIGKLEMKQCRDSIEKQAGEGFDLATVYKEIAKDKIAEAKKNMEELKNEPKKDTAAMYNILQDFIAAGASIKELEAGKDPKRANMFKIERGARRDVYVNLAVNGYIKDHSAEQILADMEKGPAHMIKNLKEYQSRMTDDRLMAREPRQKQNVTKPQAPKPLGF